MMNVCKLAVVLGCVILIHGVGAAVAAEPAWKVVVELDDGSRIVGEPAARSIRFRTETAERDISLRELVSAWVEDGKWIASTEEGQGTTLSGQIVTESLNLKTLVGTVRVPIRHAVALDSYSTVVGVDFPARADLVLYLGFDQGGGKRARNLVSFRHHAQVLGAKWTADGKHGGAYEFDGHSSLQIPHHPELCPAAFTLAAWVYPKDPAASWRLVISKTNVSSWYGGYGFFRNYNDSRNLFFYAGNYSSGAVQEPIPQGQWTHLAGVFDGKQAMLYVNGEPSVPVNLADRNLTMQHTTTPLLIGGGGSYNWIGKLDEVMLFRRALSAKEIEELMTARSERDAAE